MRSNALSALLRPFSTRLRNLARRGVVTRVDEGRKLREIQVRTGAGELRDRVEHFEPYGFTSSPLNDAEALVINLGADRAQSVAIVVADRRQRPKNLNLGDVALYAADGAIVIVRKGGGIEITSPAAITIVAPELHVQGKLTVTGDVEAGGNVKDAVRTMAADRLIFNAHTHTGVQSGGSTTAPPLPQE